MKQITIHKLKIWTEFFESIMNGTKTFEVRYNDRNFKVGDRLDLMEWNPETKEYTGNHCHKFISYILNDNPFLDLKGYVILGLKAGIGEHEPNPDSNVSTAELMFALGKKTDEALDIHNNLEKMLKKPVLEPKIYHNQQLMNDLNEIMIRIKRHLFLIPGDTIKPTNEELDDITNQIMKVLQQDNEPIIKRK